MSRLVHRLARFPVFWDAARWIIEAGYRGEKRAILDELGELSGRLLDVGCGTGIYSPLFPDAAYTGVDLSEAYVARARSKHPAKKFLAMDALALQFADASFAAVLMVGFLHHLADADVEQALSEVRRVLEPGGKFVLIEDCPTRSRLNVPGRLLQSLDAGDHIRPPEWYERALAVDFTLLRTYPVRSGLWDYFVYVLESNIPRRRGTVSRASAGGT